MYRMSRMLLILLSCGSIEVGGDSVGQVGVYLVGVGEIDHVAAAVNHAVGIDATDGHDAIAVAVNVMHGNARQIYALPGGCRSTAPANKTRRRGVGHLPTELALFGIQFAARR